MAVGLIRCPRCGNENRADSFQCSFCGKRLRIEKIEKFQFFRRIEEEWVSPAPWYKKIYWLFLDPARAFHDINHERSKAPGYLILLFNTVLWGLMGLAVMAHIQFVSINGKPVSPYSISLIPYGLIMFLTFLIIGFIFQLIFYHVLIWLFSLGANYAVGFSKILEDRFGKEKEEKYKESEMSPFSIYKSGTLMQRQAAYKYKMLMCAFAPLLLINTIKILIILIALPTVRVDISSGNFNDSILTKIFSSPTWAVLDVIDALTMAIWIPILMTFAIRELSNSSTFRVLISSFIIGTAVAIFFFFLRPTLFG
ncbi:MAG: zinc ribbon domain-containing protein [Promethearchaeota archaeon]|nr:MAG: zinc ribbon domain-containing protein [Candidatus Lokiarchaeota archaeon]